MTDPMLPLPGLSLVGAKKIVAQFDGGQDREGYFRSLPWSMISSSNVRVARL
jgi:hypothetical protein